MKKIFSMNGGLFRAMTIIYQVLCLNLLFLLTSFPIVTIGASTVALYRCTLKIASGDEPALYRTYMAAFKSNFKQGFVAGLGMLVGALFFFYAIRYALFQKQPIIVIIMVSLSAIFLFTSEYLFPMLAHYENQLGAQIRNALVLSFQNAALSIVCFISNAVLIVLFPILLPKLFFLWVFLEVAGAAMINSKIMTHIFQKYDDTEGQN